MSNATVHVRVLAAAAALVLVTAFASAQQRQAEPASGAGETAGPALNGNAAHGQYLVERVVMCAECHSSRDSDGNIIPSMRFYGGPLPLRPVWSTDFALTTPRIARLPGYTDAEALRVLTQGAISRRGTQLRPPMPRFRMTPEDAADVIAFLRSLP